jgi:hypothetical protein
MKPWQIPLNKAPNKGVEKKEQAALPQEVLS